MKRFFTLCILTLVLFLGTQSIEAQEKFKSLDEMAQVQSQEVKKLLNLDDNQTTIVWRALYSRARAYAENINGNDLKKKSVSELKDKIDTSFKETLLKVLTEEQFKTFTSWLAKNQ